MKKIFLAIIAIASLTSSFAQEKTSKRQLRKQKVNEIVKQEEEGVISYKKHFAGGLKLFNDGYGVFLEKGKSQSDKKALLFQLDIAERKHDKEEKSVTQYNANPLIYGKINYFYPVKLGVQQQILLGNKGNKNGVNITGNFGGGLNIGILRAYQIEVNTGSERKSVYYESADSLLFLNAGADPSAVGPSLFKGWSKVSVAPGLYAKASLRFDYAPYNESITALEIGLFADFYGKKIPQMVYQKQKQFFISPYVSLVFGKRK